MIKELKIFAWANIEDFNNGIVDLIKDGWSFMGEPHRWGDAGFYITGVQVQAPPQNIGVPLSQLDPRAMRLVK